MKTSSETTPGSAGPDSAAESSSTARRAKITFYATIAVVWAAWLYGMISGDRFGLFADNFFMSITMAFGSFIAGATSEGGGAVAFPVMTLVFKIKPAVARDFSLMIQTVGMTAAAIAIFATRIRVEKRALIFGSLGGAIGIIVGLEQVAPRTSPPFAKMLFTSSWMAFAFALYWINRYREREVHHQIMRFLPRHALLLFGTGLLGGVVSSITGSGLDITIFALLVLRLRIDERVATPTSVVLMAGNAAVGFFWKAVFGNGMAPEAWNYWWVCIPVVVVGAPFGARFIRNRSRHFVAGILYVSIIVQFVAALVIVKQTTKLALFSMGVFATGLLIFHLMARGGVRRLDWLNQTAE